MNPSFRKFYKELTHWGYDLVHIPWKVQPLNSLTYYTNYAWHLARVYGPRISHFETMSDAYTPARTKYNIYLVYGLIGGYAFWEAARLRQAKASAAKARLENRP